MKNTSIKKLIATLAFPFVTFLSGCSLIDSGPSQEEINRLVKAALTTQLNNTNNANPFGGILSKIIGTDQLVINKIEKVNCKNEREKIYTCEIFVDYDIGTQDQPTQQGGATPPFRSNQKIQKTMTFNFFKSGTGWENTN